MEQDHGAVWGYIHTDPELAQREVDGAIISNFKSQVAKIDSFTNNMESSVRSSIKRLREITNNFSNLKQIIEARKTYKSGNTQKGI